MTEKEKKIQRRSKWLKIYAQTGSVTKTALRCGIARSTLYRWIKRYEEHGENGLSDKSQHPQHLANIEIESLVLKLRETRRWGVGTLFQRLRHFSAKQSAMPSSIFMGKYSTSGGRRSKADPSVNRYVVRFNAEEKARLLSMFEQSEAINKAAFIKNFLFSESFHGLCCR